MNWWKVFHQAMTNLNMKPWELGAYTIPQLMALMSDIPPSHEERRITSAAQWQAVCEQLDREEREWMGNK